MNKEIKLVLYAFRDEKWEEVKEVYADSIRDAALNLCPPLRGQINTLIKHYNNYIKMCDNAFGLDKDYVRKASLNSIAPPIKKIKEKVTEKLIKEQNK